MGIFFSRLDLFCNTPSSVGSTGFSVPLHCDVCHGLLEAGQGLHDLLQDISKPMKMLVMILQLTKERWAFLEESVVV